MTSVKELHFTNQQFAFAMTPAAAIRGIVLRIPPPVARAFAPPMPYHFEFEPVHRILVLVYEGDVQGSEVEEANREMAKHVARLKPAGGLADLTAVTTLNVKAHEMRRAALQPSPYPADVPRFIIAPTDHLFGMARMYEIIADRPPEKLTVVRSWKAALDGLGVQEARFRRID